MATWADIKKTMPEGPPKGYGQTDEFGTSQYDPNANVIKANVPGLGEIQWQYITTTMDQPPEWTPVIDDPQNRTQDILRPAADGGITRNYVPYGKNESIFKTALETYGPMAAVIAGGAGLGNAFGGAGTLSTDAAMANLANVGGMGSGSELVGNAIGSGAFGGTGAASFGGLAGLDAAGLGGAEAAGALPSLIPAAAPFIPPVSAPPAVPPTVPNAPMTPEMFDLPPPPMVEPPPLTALENPAIQVPPMATGYTPGVPDITLPSLPAVPAAAVPAAAATPSILDSLPKGVIPAVAGAVLGGIGASDKPAGTTTTTQDLPDWLKPYVTGNLEAAKSYMTANPQDNSLLKPAMGQLQSTIAGDYLNSNPYIDATFAKARDAVGSGIDSRFTSAGRYGSGAHQGVLGTTFGNLATDIYGNNYANERKLQSAASLAAPDFTSASAGAPFTAFNAFGNLTKQNVSSTSTPYFTNPAGGILSGALAGYGLSKAFG